MKQKKYSWITMCFIFLVIAGILVTACQPKEKNDLFGDIQTEQFTQSNSNICKSTLSVEQKGENVNSLCVSSGFERQGGWQCALDNTLKYTCER